jgi:nucleotide-binding universal stress UspA family protein
MEALEKMENLLSSEDEGDLDLHFVVKSGDVADGIAAAAREEGADVAVLGSHHRGFFAHLLLGSTNEELLRKADIPVLSVGPGPMSLKLGRILVATDLSEVSNRGFLFALGLARALRSELVVVYVHDVRLLPMGEGNPEARRRDLPVLEAGQRLAAFETEGALHRLTVRTVLAQGVAAEEILKTAEAVDAGLILLTVEKRGVLERALLGSTAERVVRDASVPVLAIPGSLMPNPGGVVDSGSTLEGPCVVEHDRVIRHGTDPDSDASEPWRNP